MRGGEGEEGGEGGGGDCGEEKIGEVDTKRILERCFGSQNLRQNCCWNRRDLNVQC